MQTVRLIMYHKQSTSARTRFLALDYGGVCAFAGLPQQSRIMKAEARRVEKVVVHPAVITREAECKLGLPAGALEADAGFRIRVDVPGGALDVHLARFTTIDPPWEAAQASGARFIDITQARGLPRVELQLLREAYERILG